MPSPSATLSQSAYAQSRQAIVSSVAANLRARSALLIAGGYVSSPPEPDWNALANEAIEQRSIAGVPLASFPPTEGGQSIDSLIPTSQRAHAIASEVAAGVAENTGSIGFLRGATIGQALSGFWNMIRERGFGAAISGVFNLIFGNGDSPEARALTGYIGNQTATAIGNGVTTRLQARQAELGLSSEQIAEIGLQAQNAARLQAGLPPLQVPGQAPTSPPTPGTLSAADQNSIRNVVRNQVIGSLGLQEMRQADGSVALTVSTASTTTAITGRQTLARLAQVAGVASFTPPQHAALVDTMTNALQSVVTASPPPANPTATRDLIQQQLQASFASRAGELGLSALSAADLSNLARVMADDMTVQFYAGRPRPQDRSLGQAFASDPARLQTYREAQQGLAAAVIRRQFDSPTVTPMQIMLDQIARARATGEPPTWQPLSESERNAMINSMAAVMTSDVAQRTNPPATRAEFIAAAMSQFERDSTAMGLGSLTAENRTQMLQQLAGAMYDEQNRSQQQPQSMQALVGSRVRETLAAQFSGPTLNLLALGAGGNQVNANNLVNALTPAMTAIVSERITDRDTIVGMLTSALQTANPPTGIPADQIARLAGTIADDYLHPRPGISQAAARHTLIHQEVSNCLSGMDSNVGTALAVAGYQHDAMTQQITTALERVVTTEGFHAMNPAQRRALITQAVQRELEGGPLDGMLASYVANQLTGGGSGVTIPGIGNVSVGQTLTTANGLVTSTLASANTLPNSVGLPTVSQITSEATQTATNMAATANILPTQVGLPTIGQMANATTSELGTLANQVVPGSGPVIQRLTQLFR